MTGVRVALAVAVLSLLTGCSAIKKMVVLKPVASTLSQTGDLFARDDDPELVRAAVPFALKTYESLLDSLPKYEPLLVATCAGFTEYSFTFIQTDADLIRDDDHARAKELDVRALKMYLRAKGYCLRAMDVRFPGIGKQLSDNPEKAVLRAKNKKDVELLYWAAASWGAAVSLAVDQPDIAIDFPAVQALAKRAITLDDTWGGRGALDELMITLVIVPEAMGGSRARAIEHFTHAVELQKGLSAGPYVSLALNIYTGPDDRADFEKTLKLALAIDENKDPSTRLPNLLNKRRAQALLDHIDAHFAK